MAKASRLKLLATLTRIQGGSFPAPRQRSAPGDYGEGESAEALVDLDADPARVFAGTRPALGAGGEVMVGLDEVVGRLHQDGAQATVAASAQRSVGVIDLIALVARGHEGGASGD